MRRRVFRSNSLFRKYGHEIAIAAALTLIAVIALLATWFSAP